MAFNTLPIKLWKSQNLSGFIVSFLQQSNQINWQQLIIFIPCMLYYFFFIFLDFLHMSYFSPHS